MGVSLFFICLDDLLVKFIKQLRQSPTHKQSRTLKYAPVYESGSFSFFIQIRHFRLNLSRTNKAPKQRITASTPIRSKITYFLYVGFCFGWVFPCSSSVWGLYSPYFGVIIVHFAAPLYTVCVFSKTEHEPQGGEHMSAELVAHSFEAYLYTEFALSKTKHEPQRRLAKGASSLANSTSERASRNSFRP